MRFMETIKSHFTGPAPRPSRTLHLVDAENLAGSPCFTLVDAAAVQRAYCTVLSPGSDDQFVVATSHHAALPTWFAWPHATRRLVQSGPDGADLALLAVIEREGVVERFSRVVIGSGDGIFALAAARLRASGCAVTVISRRTGLSRALRLAVADIRFIDPPSAPASALASVRLAA
jgi:hypothetical protein